MSLVKRRRQDETVVAKSRDDVFTLEGHEGTVMAAKFDREGRVLATGGMDKKILLWSLPHVNQRGAPNYGEITGHKSAITSLRWLNSGLLASSSADSTVAIWDAETGKKIRKLNKHSMVVNEIDQDSNLVASVGDDGFVQIWDTQSKDPVSSFQTDYPLITVAFHRGIVYASGIEPVIRAWDIKSSSRPLFEIETMHTDTITSIAVDDSNLISRSNDDTLRIYDPSVVEGTHIRPQIYDGAPSGGENLPIRAIIRENVIYSGSSDNTVTFWDVTSKRLLRKTAGHSGTVIDIDEHMGKLASTSVDGKVILRYTSA